MELATGHRYSFAALNARANRLAHFLRDRLGVEKGERVSILVHNSVVYCDLFYAMGKLGAVLAPLNWRLAAHELAYIVTDNRPKALRSCAGPNSSPPWHHCGPRRTQVSVSPSRVPHRRGLGL